MWNERPLGELATITSGGTPARDVPAYWNGDVPWVTPSDITACAGNVLVDTSERISRQGLAASAARLVPAQSVLLTSRATVGEARLAGVPVTTNQGFKSLTAKTGVDPWFLFYQVQRCRGLFERYAAGRTFLEIGKRDTERIPVLHPTSVEQQRRIAAILIGLDAAIEATEALIEKHKQIKAGLMHDLFTRGVGKDRRIGPRGGELPAGWRWVSLGQLAKIVSGVTLGGAGPAAGIVVPYLRVANVQDGYLDLTEIKTIRVAHAVFEELRLLPGDVLMNEGGDFDKLGRGTVWAGEVDDCVHQNHVFRVRTDRSLLLPEFLAFHSESEYGKRYFLVSSKQSTNLASINATQLRRYPIALPPLDEQARLVERVAVANAHQAALQRSVEKLRAQKLGLMQDLLTGKVPVTVQSPSPVHV